MTITDALQTATLVAMLAWQFTHMRLHRAERRGWFQ